MLSFPLSEKTISNLRELSSQAAVLSASLRSLSEEEKEAIHCFARVSQIGASTRIENAVLTDSEVLWIDTLLSKSAKPTAFKEEEKRIEDKLSKDKERSIEEVAGCRNMLLLIYEQGKDFFPFTESDLRGFHKELLQFYPSANHYLGKYKTVTNSVIERNHQTGEERIVFKTADPGPITDVVMKELVQWYNENHSGNPWTFAVACEFVYRFLSIHPFQDGNGRLSRGLFLLVLLQSPDLGLSQIARYVAIDRQIERHRREYYYVLQKCSGGRFYEAPNEYKIEFFLNFMIKMMNLAFRDIEVYRKRYAVIKKLSLSALKVLDCFKEFPEKRLQVKEIAGQTDLPTRTVSHVTQILLKSELIQSGGQGAGTYYQVIF